MRPGVYPTKDSSANGRYVLSRRHLYDAQRDLDIAHALAKREGRVLGSFKHIAWGCGCCVLVSETRKFLPEERRTIQNLKIRRINYFEDEEGAFLQGQRRLRHKTK